MGKDTFPGVPGAFPSPGWTIPALSAQLECSQLHETGLVWSNGQHQEQDGNKRAGWDFSEQEQLRICALHRESEPCAVPSGLSKGIPQIPQKSQSSRDSWPLENTLQAAPMDLIMGMFEQPSRVGGFASQSLQLPLGQEHQVCWGASNTSNSQWEQSQRDWAQLPHSSCRTSPALSPKLCSAPLAPAPADAWVGNQEVPQPPGEGMRGKRIPLPCWQSSAPPAQLSC